MSLTTSHNTSYDTNYERKRKYSLVYAIRRGHFSNIRFMLDDECVNPNEVYQSNDNPNNTLSITPNINVSNSHYGMPIVTNLNQLTSAAYSYNGRTPLMVCSLIEDDAWAYSIAQNLIEKGAILGIKDLNGLNALMYACVHQRKHLVNLYLNALGDYNLLDVDNFGNTAMHIASLGRAQSICALLHETCLKYDINPINGIPKNKFGHTPYDLCVANGHKACINNYLSLQEQLTSKSSKSNNSVQHSYNNHLSTPTKGLQYRHSFSASNVNQSLTDTQRKFQNLGVACPSILFEASESSISPIEKTPPDSTRFHEQRSPQSPTPSLRSHITSHVPPNVAEVYKNVYAFREPFIKANTADLNSFYGKNRDAKMTKSRLNKHSSLSVNKITVPDSVRKLRERQSPLKKPIKTNDDDSLHTEEVVSNEASLSDSHNDNRKKDVNSISPKTTWRNQVNKIFDALELQNSESYRKSHAYVATSFEAFSSMQYNLHANNYLGFNRKSSVQQRKSIMSATPGVFQLSRKQSTSITKSSSRKPSVIANA